MKETKVYVDELPKCCCDCICYNDHAEQCKINPKLEMSEFNYNLAYEYECYSDRERHPNCPLKSLHDHDKELVAKVLEKTKTFVRENTYICGGNATREDIITSSSYNQALRDFLDFMVTLQKEFKYD